MHTTSDGDDAAPARGGLRGMECSAQNRIRTVCADEEITLDAIAVSQFECDSMPVLSEAGGLAAECDRPHADGIEQRTVQRRPKRDDHRATPHRLGVW